MSFKVVQLWLTMYTVLYCGLEILEMFLNCELNKDKQLRLKTATSNDKNAYHLSNRCEIPTVWT